MPCIAIMKFKVTYGGRLLCGWLPPDKPTACLSFNYHQDHFGSIWGLKTADGETAYSACVGFGLERITLALFKHHGLDPGAWPESVRAALEL